MGKFSSWERRRTSKQATYILYQAHAARRFAQLKGKDRNISARKLQKVSSIEWWTQIQRQQMITANRRDIGVTLE